MAGQRFENVTAAAGLDISFYGMGCAVGDYDNNGWEDLYVSAVLGPGHLFHNRGGRFEDVTVRAGVGNAGKWGMSCAWLDCDLVIVAIGIRPNVDVLSGSGIALDNGILVDAHCQTSVPQIFAAGDVANILHPLFGRVRVEHFNNAEKQGRAAARALLGNLQPYDYIYSFWSDQYEDKIEYVGYASRWDRLVVRGSYESKTFLAFYLTHGIMQAACGLNRGGDPEIEADSELRACQQLIGKRVRLSEEALADDRVDLRSLQEAT